MDNTHEAPMIEDRHLTVDKHLLHIHSGGVTSKLPTIVLEAGCGCTLQTWHTIEQALGAQTRVLAYERAGVGSSDCKVDSTSAAAVAQRLASLLQATQTPTPVILVGHSLGGLYSRYFAATRPEQVAGLVLLDASPEDLPTPRSYSWKPRILMWLLHGLARLRVIQPLAALLSKPGTDLAALKHHLNTIGRFRHVKTALMEIGAKADIQAEVARLSLAAQLPVLAVSAGAMPPGAPQEQHDAVQRSHDKLAAAGAPPYSRHFRVEGATHMSLLTDPQYAAVVAKQVLDFARQIQQKTGA
ncbi:MAG TPA: alpha/beta hydrolase [Solimonas sp.]|nr:alpha/beta hydrolase [Solimonas sp.]